MKINIPNACSEDFSKMTPTEKGKFCNKCSKEVIDFKNSSLEEIKTTLDNSTNVCAAIQSQKIVDFNSKYYPKRRMPLVVKWLPAGMLSLLTSINYAQQNQEFTNDSTLHEEMKVVLSQTNHSTAKKPQINNHSTKNPLTKNSKVKKTTQQSDSIFTAKGTILQEDNLPLVGVLVYNKNQIDNGVITNKNGEFSIQAKLGDTLVMEFENGSTLTYDINSYNSIHIIYSNSNQLKLNKSDDEPILIGEIVRHRKFPNKVLHALSFPFRKIREVLN